MFPLPSSLPVLRFCAGSLKLGIAAADVVAVVDADEDIIHIANVLGVTPASGEHRVIYLAQPDDEDDEAPLISFIADTPVEVARCRAEDIIPVAPGLPIFQWRPVMGFADISGETVVLLDIPSLLAEITNTRQRGQS